MAFTEHTSTSTGDGTNWSECQICLSSMVGRNPRALNCLHTFCETCLIQLPTIESHVTCPTCRGQTKLPTDGVSGLPINFMIEQAATKVNQVNLCQTCAEAECSQFCMDGCGRLCSSCKMRHDSVEGFKKHHVKLLDNPEEVSDTHCLDHGKILQLFCKKCQTCLCSTCALSATHLGHEGLIVDMKNEYEKTRSNIIDGTKAIEDVCELKLSKIQWSENHFKYITRQMENQYECLKRKLDGKRENLLGAISELSAPLTEFRSKVNSIRERSKLIDDRSKEEELDNCKRQKISEVLLDEKECKNLQKEAEDLKAPVVLVKSYYIPRRASEIKLGRLEPKDISVGDRVRVKTYNATNIEHLSGKIGKVSGCSTKSERYTVLHEYLVDFPGEINVRCEERHLEVVHD